MARPTNRLTDTWLRKAKIGNGIYADGASLYLRVQGASRSWLFIYTDANRKRREMGLGAYPAVSLKDARSKAEAARQLRAEGRDPIEAKRIATGGDAEAATFEKVARDWINLMVPTWTGAEVATRYQGYLRNWTFTINALPVGEIDKHAVASTLRPIWGKPTGDMVRSFIERVLGYAMVRELRPEGLNPARLRGNIDSLLKAPKHVTTHHAAIGWRDVPALMLELAGEPSVASSALRLAILTASRQREIRELRWREVQADRLVIDAKRYKTRQEHTVPISAPAKAILDAMPRGDDEALVFEGTNSHSFGSLLKEGTPHGIARSSFAVWAVENGFSTDDVDRCLGHIVGSEVTRSYVRSDFFEAKARLLSAWGEFIDGC
ncbi:tyrosine-type recombinase/integrase [Bauldia litoralis]|uniref:Phage integrase family protein n=1 Tax=Bauldia litoralis TaxID=665467 RepID=A0A1G6DTU4_9HYPH|nr:integrase arm-type DNA-binding domain-containing protein [Bauldia litoralis]SDB48538.1 Phage integrase family protein [Bauldia litoralis]